MPDREDELHLLGFLATLAGLLGIVVGVSQFQVGSASSATVRVYFSAMLGFAVGLAAASLLPLDAQFGGFWVIAITAAFSFCWTLQRWHRKLEWGSCSR